MPIEPSAGPVQSEVQSSQDAATTPDSVPTPVAAAAGGALPGYELFEEIGRGGMGVVYRARDLALNREVAVKILQEHFAPDSSAAARFAAEAQITGQLQHPGIPAVYQVGQLHDRRPFLAMKLIRGQTLDALLKADTKLDYLPLIEAVAQAVGYAHAHQVIHRDLKPANVMVGSFGEVQVMDWGLAKLQKASTPPHREASDPNATTGVGTEIRSVRDSDGEFTHAGSVLGTPNYMAPEQAAGELNKVDARADVFGIGGILCALLTGKPPFSGKDAESVRLNAVRGKTEEAFARLDACGAEPESIALCKRCLHFEPDQRPDNAQAVAHIVATMRRAAEERARQAELDKARAEVQVAEQRHRRRLVLLASGAVAAVLLLGMIGTTFGLFRAEEAKDAERRRAEAEIVATKEARAAERRAEERRVQAEAATVRESQAKALAQAAEKRAEDRRKEAEAATEIAQQRFSLALEAYNQMVFAIQNKLEIRPGTLALRKNLLENARTGLQELLRAAEKQGNADGTLAMSYLRLGRVEMALGNTVAAIEAFDKGRDLAQKLVAADPDNAEAQRALGISFDYLGDAALQAGRSKEAIQFFQKYNDISQRLVAADPDNVQGQRDLAISFTRMGDVTLQSGQSNEALQLFQKANEVSQKLADAEPKNVQAQRDLNHTFERLGEVHAQMGQPRKALPFYQKYNEGCQRLATAAPKNAEAQRDLSVSLLHLGEVTLKLGQAKEALPYNQKANEISQRLADADPNNAQMQRDLGVSLAALGDVSMQLRQAKEALTYHQKATVVFEKLAAADPKNAEAQQDLGLGYERVGTLFLEMKQTKEALKNYQKSVEVMQRLADADRKNTKVQHQLSISLCRLGDVTYQTGQTQDAVAWYETGSAHLNVLFDK